MSRGAIHQIIFIVVVSLIVVFGCASAQQSIATLPIRIENNVFDQVTVFVVNHGRRLRIGDCSGASICWLRANPNITRGVLSDQYISLGWRFLGDPPMTFKGIGTTAAFEDAVIVLLLNRTNWFLYSELLVNKKAD